MVTSGQLIAVVVGGLLLFKKKPSSGTDTKDGEQLEQPPDNDYVEPTPSEPPAGASRPGSNSPPARPPDSSGALGDLARTAGDLASKARDQLAAPPETPPVSDWFIEIDDPVVEQPEPSPDPYAPTLEPIQGQYYKVQEGDSPISIAKAAGLEGWQWTKMRDHERNAWFPKKHTSGAPFPGFTGAGIPVFRWFEEPGYMTVMHTYPKSYYTFLVLYIPTAAELEG